MPSRNETAAPAGAENSTLYVAIEISRKSWVVGIKSPVNERIGLHTIEAANVDALRDLIERHRAKAERVLDREVRVLNYYEAGYEGFWLARWLDGARALETVVLDPASLLVNREAKQRKTDRIDAKKMVRALLAHDRGDAAVLSQVRVPSVEQEDRKRLLWERQRLVKERTSLTNSIKGLLKLHGIFDLQPRSKDFEAKFADVATAYGEPLPPRARQEILRIAERLALVEEQIARVEAERNAFVLSGEAISMVDAPEGSQARAAAKIAALTRLKAIGPNDATILTHEVFYRGFRNRRELASWVGVTPTCPSHLFHPSQKPWNFASPPDTLSGMHKIIEIFADRAALHTEILALRQQVAVLKRKRPRPLLRKADRVFWVILSCLWPGWRHALVIVRPETVIGWHRKGFRLFWTWKSRRGKPGRPPVSREICDLVRRMSRENTRWGAPRIHGELLKLGFSISQAAVSKYMVRYPSPPSQSWRTFRTNHADCLASIDFFVVPTATFHLLFGFIVLHHERRQIVHFGVTANPTMAWVAQQIREAFPWGTAPRYLIRDRDGAYGQSFRSTVTAMGVEEVVTAPRSPWQNPYVERLIGSVRRECLDHSIILNERHLRRILGSYLDYYHGSRTHLSIGKDTPDGRPVQPAGSGTVVSLPKVGGLHHRYERLAA